MIETTEIVAPPAIAADVIFEQRQYVNDKGVGVTTKTDLATGTMTYFGQGKFQFDAGGQQGTATFGFEIKATSIQEAFVKLPDAMMVAGSEAKSEMHRRHAEEQQRIVIANAVQSASLAVGNRR